MNQSITSINILIRLVIVVACLAGSLLSIVPGSSHPLEQRSSEILPVKYGSDVIRIIDVNEFARNQNPRNVSNDVQHVSIIKSAATGTEFVLNYMGVWTPEQTQAMDYAASLWSQMISSPVPIEIDVNFKVMSGAGECGFSSYLLDSANAPFPHTYYPTALANAIMGSDQNAGSPEMIINFNQGYNWYYGVDGMPSAMQLDFVTVAMHELTHGLLGSDSFVLFGSDMYAWGGAQWGYTTFLPDIMDWYMVDGSGQNLTNTNIYPNPSTALYDRFSQADIYFSGPVTLANNGNQPGKLENHNRPHLDSIYSNTQNGMMISFLGVGESIHNPGPIILGILADIGWDVTANTAPNIHQLPNILVEMDREVSSALDLWAFTSDTHSQASELIFSIANSPAVQAGVSLRENRYIDISPDPGWLGQTVIEIQAQDPQGLSSRASLSVLIVEEVYSFGLPMVNR